MKFPGSPAAIVALAFVLTASPAVAQTIHGYPGKAFYANESEWPKQLSFQCHWDRTLSAPLMPSHTHVDIGGPRYAEIGPGLLRVPFTLKLFHTSGRATVPWTHQEAVVKVEWDETGSEVEPALIGDPMGLKVWTGHLTYDPLSQVGNHPAPLRGWWSPAFTVFTYLDDGAQTQTLAFPSFYTVLDPTATETPGEPSVNSRCIATSSDPTKGYGVNLVDTIGFFPLTPISAPWTLFRAGTSSYGGAPTLPPATYQLRADLDLHNGIPGAILTSITADGDIVPGTVVLDPARLGAGPHKIALMRFQPAGDEQVTTLLVFDIEVGAGVPPPTTCQNPAANNVGQPLPCTFPPPTPTWTVVPTPTFERLGDLERRCYGNLCTLPQPVSPR